MLGLKTITFQILILNALLRCEKHLHAQGQSLSEKSAIELMIQNGLRLYLDFSDNDFLHPIPPFKIIPPKDIPQIIIQTSLTPSWKRQRYPHPISQQLIDLCHLQQWPDAAHLAQYLSSHHSDVKLIRQLRNSGNLPLSMLSKHISQKLPATFLTELKKAEPKLTTLAEQSPVVHPQHELEICECIQHTNASLILDIAKKIMPVIHQYWMTFSQRGQATPNTATNALTTFPTHILTESGLSKFSSLFTDQSSMSTPHQTATYKHPKKKTAAHRVNLKPIKATTATSIMQHSQCAFKHFANKILNLRDTQTAAIQYASQYGQLLHHVFQNKITPPNMDNHDNQTAKLINQMPFFAAYPPHLKTILEAHIENILTQWSEIDHSRPQHRIFANEIEVDYEYQGIKISARIDRVDELSPGQYLLIDYKSSPHSANWYQENQLYQLPIYAVLFGKKTSALAYGILKRDHTKLTGHCHETIEHAPLKGINQLGKNYQNKADWDSQLEHWQTQLHQQLQEMQAGEIQPNPNSTLCNTCHFTYLCQRKELQC